MDLANIGERLSLEDLPVIHSFLRKSADIHPGGMIYDLSRNLGASKWRSELAGSVSEMFYAACSSGDDIQDEEASYTGVELPFQINSQSQLLCLVAIRMHELNPLNVDILYAALSTMLIGQRMELARDPWNVDVYKKVARLSAGEQYGAQLTLSCIAANDIDRQGHLYLWGVNVGMLLQLVADIQSKDERLMCLGDEAISEMKSEFVHNIVKSQRACGKVVHRYTEILCSSVDK